MLGSRELSLEPGCDAWPGNCLFAERCSFPGFSGHQRRGEGASPNLPCYALRC